MRVKGLALPTALATLAAATFTLAEDTPPDWLDPTSGLAPPSVADAPPEETVEVPENTIVIEDQKPESILFARTFNVRVLRRSTSNRVYMLEKTSGELPEPGRILLLREGEEPVMAFRVIRVYPETQTLAARKLKRYSEDLRALPRRKLYTAVEKVADLILETDQERLEKSKDASDLGELELASGGGATSGGATPGGAEAAGGAGVGTAPPAPGLKPLPSVAEYDPELDMPSRGPFASEGEGQEIDPAGELGSLDEESTFDEAGLIAKEVNPYDFFANGFSAMGSFHRNNGPEGEAIYLRGVGFRYSHTTNRMVLLKRTSFQDSLTFEGGLSYYKVFVYAADNDAYGVVPATLDARYNIHFSPSLSVFFYAGLTKPFVIEGTQATEEAVSQLSALLPAAGAGLIVGVGPNWDLRADVGIDQVGAGLMLRF